jgi:hypothetical protein
VSLDVSDNPRGGILALYLLALDGVLNGIAAATAYYLSSPELLKTNTHLHMLIDRLSLAKTRSF